MKSIVILSLLLLTSIVHSETIDSSKMLDTSVDSFVSKWDTTNTSNDSSLSDQIMLPLESSGIYDFNIDWGDGNIDHITAWNQTQVLHNYDSSGIYTLIIDGTITGWRFNNKGDRLKLIELSQWGNLKLGNNGNYFHGAANMKLIATDTLDLNGTSVLQSIFSGCTMIGASGTMEWDTSRVTNLNFAFSHATTFNMDISGWNTSNVRQFIGTFNQAENFNQALPWDLSSATNIRQMFSYAKSFNQVLDWNVTSVVDISYTFQGAKNFNQVLNWDVGNVIYMKGTFANATSFNQDLNWNIGNVEHMDKMFLGAESFNSDISNWDTSKVIDYDRMFENAKAFNGDIASWSTTKANKMNNMFYGASSFNGNIGNWNTINVLTFNGMFRDAVSFNSDISNWNLLEAQDISHMFDGATKFNQDISGWNVKNAVKAEYMFRNADSFNSDVSDWNIRSMRYMKGFMDEITIPTNIYDNMLRKWAGMSLQYSVQFSAGNSKYSDWESRDYLIEHYNWNITDAGHIDDIVITESNTTYISSAPRIPSSTEDSPMKMHFLILVSCLVIIRKKRNQSFINYQI